MIISRINGFTCTSRPCLIRIPRRSVSWASTRTPTDPARLSGATAQTTCRRACPSCGWRRSVASITGNSTNPTRFQHPVAGTYQKWCIENGVKYFSVASGGGTAAGTLHPDNMAAGPSSYGMTDTMGSNAFRRPVRRLLLRPRTRGDDGTDRYGQQPHGRRNGRRCRGC